jgi:hypothetical protein
LATRRTTRPLGASGVAALSFGTLDGCFPSYPGPVSSVAFDASGQPWNAARGAGEPERLFQSSRFMSAGKPDSGAWIPLDLKQPASNKSSSGPSRAHVRVARSSESDAGYERLSFQSTDAALAAAMRLVDHPAAAAHLRDLLAT